MGTNYFHQSQPKAFRPPGARNEQSAAKAGVSASKSAGNAAQRNLATAAAMGRYMKMPAQKRRIGKKV